MIKILFVNTDQRSYDPCYHIIKTECSNLKGIDPNSIIINHPENSKPYCENVSSIYFNISRTSGMAAIAISDSEIGIDIEKKLTLNIPIPLHMFHDDEHVYLAQAKNDQQKLIRFYELWTQKEAYSKYLGKGLSLRTDSYSVRSASIQSMLYTGIKNNYVFSICSQQSPLDIIYQTVP